MSGFMRAVIFGMVFVFLCCVGYSHALETEFHGRVQSTYVMRDYSGFQYGFMDDLKGIQWRNELKFDITAVPEYEGFPSFRMEKLFLSYRGAYDAIFDLTDRFDDRGTFDEPGLRDKSPHDWELGKDDLETENDLREAFLDFAGEFGDNSFTMRLGRQIVQWGEADGFVMVNQVNPFDNSTLLFFEMPEDLATPLWMGRFNFSRSYLGPLRDLGVELILNPDIRPWQIAPPDDAIAGKGCAPYQFGLWQLRRRPLRALTVGKLKDLVIPVVPEIVNTARAYEEETGIPVIERLDVPEILNIVNNWDSDELLTLGQAEHLGLIWSDTGHIKWRYDVPSSGRLETLEVGVRLQAGYGSFVGNLYYYHGSQNFLAADWSQLLVPGEAWLTFPEQDLYGLSFNVFLSSINAVVRGEMCLIDRMHLLSIEGVIEGLLATLQGADPSVKGIEAHETYYYLLGFDKDVWVRWLNPTNMIKTSWQAYHRHIGGWEDDPVYNLFYEDDNYRLTGFLWTDYLHGQIHPEIFFMYDPEGVWMTMASVRYSKDGKLFYKLTQMSFWGNRGPTEGVVDGGTSDFNQPFDLIPVSEVSFRVGYNW